MGDGRWSMLGDFMELGKMGLRTLASSPIDLSVWWVCVGYLG